MRVINSLSRRCPVKVEFHRGYDASVWNHHLKRDIDLLESIQRRDTRLVPSLKGMRGCKN